MSATIYWEIIEPPKHDLSVAAPENFFRSLAEALGYIEPPNELNISSGDYAALRGLRSGLSSPDQVKAVNQLMQTICETHIKVWKVY